MGRDPGVTSPTWPLPLCSPRDPDLAGTMSAGFFDVERSPVGTSLGPVDLPILYEDASNVVALFGAPRPAAAALLEGTGLEPAMVVGGQALVALSFYEYRATTIGAYNEVATAIFARKVGDRPALRGLADLWRDPRKRRVGTWVVDLPVTTELADVGGRELWGFPKFVTRIDFGLAGRNVDCAVFAPSGEGLIERLAGTLGPSVRVPPLSLLTLTRLGGRLLRTPVDVRGATRAHLPGDVRLRVGEVRHRMADNLRTLGLDGAAPRLLLVTERFQSILHAGSNA